MAPQRAMRPEHVTGMIVILSGLAGSISMLPLLKSHPFAFSLSATATSCNIVLWTHSLVSPAHTRLALLNCHRGVLGIAAWLLQLGIAVMVFTGAVPIPDSLPRLYKQGYTFYISLFFSVSDQLHARQVLQEKWVLAIAEAHALLAQSIYTKYVPEMGWFMPLVWHHIAISVLPYMFHHHHHALSKFAFIMASCLTACCTYCQQLLLGTRYRYMNTSQPSKGGKCVGACNSTCSDQWEDLDALMHVNKQSGPEAEAAPTGDELAVSAYERLGDGGTATASPSNALSAARNAAVLPADSSLMDSRNSLMAAAHMVQLPIHAYVSPLGMHTQVALKVVSFDEPGDVPPGAAMQLQGAVRDAAAGIALDLNMEVLRVSMRRGCLLIAVDLLITGTGTAATAGRRQAGLGSSSPMNASDGMTLDAGTVIALANKLLPQLLPRMGLRSHHASSRSVQLPRAISPGTSITMQVGAQLVRALWHSESASWGVELLPFPDPSSGLASPTAVRPKLGIVTPYAVSAALDACSPRDSSDCHAAAHRMHAQPGRHCERKWRVLLSVQLFDVPEGVHVLGSTPEVVAGQSVGTGTHASSNAADSQEHEAPPIHTIQLWVQCSMGHLTTRVLGQSPTPAATGALMLQVEIEVPSAALWRHHSGGRPMQLQPLSLELWSGHSILADTTQLLLSPDQLPGIVGTAETGGAGGSTWWGTPTTISGAACEVAAVREIYSWVSEQVQLVKQTPAGGGQGETPDTMHGELAPLLQLLMRDLTHWLVGMQHATYGCAYCISPPAGAHAASAQGDAGRLHAWLPLPAAKLQHLGHHLAAFSEAAGLTHLHQLVTCQQQLLHRRQFNFYSAIYKCGANRNDGKSSDRMAGEFGSHGGTQADCPALGFLAMAVQCVSTSVRWMCVWLPSSLNGFGCALCEKPSRVWCSLALGVMGLLSFHQMAADAALLNLCTTSLYCTLHVLVGCWPHASSRWSVQHSWSRCGCRMLLLAMLVRMFGTATLTFKLLPTPHMVARQYTDGSWLVGYPMPETIEQTAARSLLPPTAVAGLALVGSVLHSCNLLAATAPSSAPMPEALATHVTPPMPAASAPTSLTQAAAGSWLRVSCALLQGMWVALLLPLLVDAWVRSKVFLRPAVPNSMLPPATCWSSATGMGGAGPQCLQDLGSVPSNKVI